MEDTAIIYSTKTGKSKKIARQIGEALNIVPTDIKECPVYSGMDLLFVVSGIYGGKSAPELLDYLRKLDMSMFKRAAILTSCASGKKGQDEVRELLSAKGITVIDEFICRGNFLFVSIGHPNKADLDAAVQFSRDIHQI
ncbi:flavodoxin family protein [Eubacteriaceae bacterium ES3]|nr:flavodoxin family protein [Eubacteriaceae bacterium ES3]